MSSTVYIRCPDDVKEALDKLSEDTGMTVTFIVVQILAAALGVPSGIQRVLFVADTLRKVLPEESALTRILTDPKPEINMGGHVYRLVS